MQTGRRNRNRIEEPQTLGRPIGLKAQERYLTRAEMVAEGVVSLEDAREFLGGISATGIYDLMNRRELPWVKVAGRRKIPVVALREYLKNHLYARDTLD